MTFERPTDTREASVRRLLAASALLVCCGVAGCAVVPGAASSGVAQEDRAVAVQEALARARGLAAARDFAAADAALRDLVDARERSLLTEELRVEIDSVAGALALTLGDLARASTLLDRATRGPAGNPAVALPAIGLALQLGKPERVPEPLRLLSVHAPEAIRDLPDEAVTDLWRAVRGQPAAERVVVLQALFDAGHTRDDGREPSHLWLELSRLHVESGEPAAAVEVARRIGSARERLALRIDRRFDEVVARLEPAQLDVADALEHEIALLRAAGEREPRRLRHVVELTYAFVEAGRYEEALAAADAALARRAEPSDEPAFLDESRYLNWVHDYRARALLGLGRIEEVIAVREAARQLAERGQPNVSQTINAAMMHAVLGNSNEALAALAGVQEASPYGWMQYHAARLSALLATPDDPRALESLAHLRANRAAAPGTYFEMLLRIGDLDAASVALRDRLADPEQRAEALLDVQPYARPTVSPLATEWAARLREVVARPEVTAAIESVGRTVPTSLHAHPF